MSGGGDWEPSSASPQPQYLVMWYNKGMCWSTLCLMNIHLMVSKHESSPTTWKATSGLPCLFCIPAITSIWKVHWRQMFWCSDNRVPILVIGSDTRTLCYVTDIGTNEVLIIKGTSALLCSEARQVLVHCAGQTHLFSVSSQSPLHGQHSLTCNGYYLTPLC